MQSHCFKKLNEMTDIKSTYVGNCTLPLSNLGLGSVQMGYDPKVGFDDAKEIILSSYLQGIRYFDSAPMYGFGRAEYTLGSILTEFNIRKDVLVSTKVGRILDTFGNYSKDPLWYLSNPGYGYDYTYDGFMLSFEDSLKRTGLDHIDLLLVHDLGSQWHGSRANIYWNQFYESGYKALDELRRNRDVSAIGLGVNETEVVVKVAAEFKIDCALIAGQYTLLNHNQAHENFKKLEESNVVIITAGVFNSGVLATGNTQTSRYNYGEVPADIASKINEINSVCSKYNISMATVALQFAVSHPSIAALVFGVKNKEEVSQNISTFMQHIPSQLWDELKIRNIINSHILVPSLLERGN